MKVKLLRNLGIATGAIALFAIPTAVTAVSCSNSESSSSETTTENELSSVQQTALNEAVATFEHERETTEVLLPSKINESQELKTSLVTNLNVVLQNNNFSGVTNPVISVSFSYPDKIDNWAAAPLTTTITFADQVTFASDVTNANGHTISTTVEVNIQGIHDAQEAIHHKTINQDRYQALATAVTSFVTTNQTQLLPNITDKTTQATSLQTQLNTVLSENGFSGIETPVVQVAFSYPTDIPNPSEAPLTTTVTFAQGVLFGDNVSHNDQTISFVNNINANSSFITETDFTNANTVLNSSISSENLTDYSKENQKVIKDAIFAQMPQILGDLNLPVIEGVSSYLDYPPYLSLQLDAQNHTAIPVEKEPAQGSVQNGQTCIMLTSSNEAGSFDGVTIETYYLNQPNLPTITTAAPANAENATSVGVTTTESTIWGDTTFTVYRAVFSITQNTITNANVTSANAVVNSALDAFDLSNFKAENQEAMRQAVFNKMNDILTALNLPYKQTGSYLPVPPYVHQLQLLENGQTCIMLTTTDGSGSYQSVTIEVYYLDQPNLPVLNKNISNGTASYAEQQLDGGQTLSIYRFVLPITQNNITKADFDKANKVVNEALKSQKLDDYTSANQETLRNTVFGKMGDILSDLKLPNLNVNSFLTVPPYIEYHVDAENHTITQSAVTPAKDKVTNGQTCIMLTSNNNNEGTIDTITVQVYYLNQPNLPVLCNNLTDKEASFAQTTIWDNKTTFSVYQFSFSIAQATTNNK